MHSKFERAGSALNALFKYLACGFLCMVIIGTFTQVFTRYVMNNSLSWTEELARYSFIWLNMLAASVALRAGTHASVNILENRLAGKALLAHQCIVYAAVIIGSALLVTQGWKMMMVAYGKPSTVMRLPMQYVYMAIPVGGLGMLAQAIFKAVALFMKKDGETAT